MTGPARMTSLPDLPEHLRLFGSAPELVAQEYLHVIEQAITNAPRSLQTRIGPSEIGAPCARRIGYKLLGVKERKQAPNWKATMGTGAHMWLETAFDGDNLRVAASEGQERWLIETKVSVGEANGAEITGSCDLYDRWTGTVIDHKTCSPTQLRKYKTQGPGEQYRVQAHLYGRGWQRAGFRVETVAIAFLPRNGELAEAHIWHEPYSEQVAADALQRLTGIDMACKMLGPAALAALPTADQYCGLCPFFRANSEDLTLGCPGDPAATAKPAPALTLTNPKKRRTL